MNDKVVQIEVTLNFLNTLFGKAISFRETNIVNELRVLRHDIYYGNDFDYEAVLKRLQIIDVNLKHYE